MGWGRGYRNSGIITLRDYEHALSWFERTVPIRGREKKGLPECRPLGHRDRPHFQIRKADDGSIQCIDYNDSNIPVTFHPDGTVTLKAKWVSNSTAAFIQEVIGLGTQVHDHSVLVYLGQGAYRIPKDGLKIQRKDKTGAWELVHNKVEVVHHINRREANNVRQQYAQFTNYLSGVLKLREGTWFEQEELVELFGVKVHEYLDSKGDKVTWESPNTPRFGYHEQDKLDALFDLVKSDDPTDMYKAAVTVIHLGCHYRVRYADTMRAWDRCMIAYHKDKVLKEVELPAGVVRKDQYSWAFR